MALGDAVKTEDGSYTVMHPELKECYHSHDGAAKEARDLYIKKSGLKERLPNGGEDLRILDVGLGLAYNALTTVDAWANCPEPQSLDIVSLEINVELVEELISGKPIWSPGWPENWFKFAESLEKITDQDELASLKEGYSFGEHFFKGKISHPNSNNAPKSQLNWLIVVGDAREADKFNPDGKLWDYVWQDPFSPEKNPKMWSAEWFEKLKRESQKDASLMTYSVSRQTKDALTEGGWEFQKLKTTTRKRNWIKANPAK
jgi:tRNA U34 5-methylaminomethyl-2-thiouridine-forming methyltransferase MnmC